VLEKGKRQRFDVLKKKRKNHGEDFTDMKKIQVVDKFNKFRTSFVATLKS